MLWLLLSLLLLESLFIPNPPSLILFLISWKKSEVNTFPIQHSTSTESFYQRITEKLVMKSVPFSWSIPFMSYGPSLKEEINVP